MEEFWFRFDLAGIWRSPFFNDFSIFFSISTTRSISQKCAAISQSIRTIIFPPNVKKNPERFRSKWESWPSMYTPSNFASFSYSPCQHHHTQHAQRPTNPRFGVNQSCRQYILQSPMARLKVQSRHLSSWRTGWENGLPKYWCLFWMIWTIPKQTLPSKMYGDHWCEVLVWCWDLQPSGWKWLVSSSKWGFTNLFT